MKKKRSIIEQALAKVKPDQKKYTRMNLDIAVRIQKILEEKGWTQQDLAQALGKQNSEISKWLTGTHNFTLRTLTRIEEVLGEDLIFSSGQAFEKYSVFATQQAVGSSKKSSSPVDYKEGTAKADMSESSGKEGKGAPLAA